MPLDAWLRLPLTASERVLHLDRNRPWLVPSALPRLEQILNRDWSVLELGAGASTAWLAARTKRVLSCETSFEWFQEVSKRCSVDIRHMPQGELVNFLDQQDKEAYDLIIIDCSGDRFPLIDPAKSLLKDGGYLILDNSDRYPQSVEVLAGWQRDTFVGVLPSPLCAQETSIFRKPVVRTQVSQ
jgi:hypothetical protein